MTSRERLMAAIRREEPDRVPVKIWGLNRKLEARHPSFQPIIDAGLRGTDFVGTWSMKRGWFLSAEVPEAHVEERPTHREEWVETVTTHETPEGPLTSSHLKNIHGKPGYRKEHMIQSREDWKKVMSVPYEPIREDCSGFAEADHEMGDEGIVMIATGSHPLYNVNQHIGSELFAIWSLAERDFLHEMLDEMLRRQMDYIKWILSQGVCGVFSYVGPELCIPPLQSVRDFREFVVEYDRQFIDVIHESGGWVWCHSHGDMGPVVDGFVDMGVDCLNPCEPPPAGSLTLAQIRERVGHKIALEGNIEARDLYMDTPEQIREKVRTAIREGAPGGAFILCPTSGFMEWPQTTQKVVDNWLAYIEAGREYGEYPITC